jgi:hypothetical protein
VPLKPQRGGWRAIVPIPSTSHAYWCWNCRLSQGVVCSLGWVREGGREGGREREGGTSTEEEGPSPGLEAGCA